MGFHAPSGARPLWQTWTQGCLHSYRFELRTGAHRTKNFDRLGGQPDSDQTIRFVAPAKEQLALVTENGLHWIPFVEVYELAEGVGNAPTSAMPILFSRQVQPAYICLPSSNG